MTFTFSGETRTTAFGAPFQAREGQWIGAKVGTFCSRPSIIINDGGWTEVDWVRFTQTDDKQ